MSMTTKNFGKQLEAQRGLSSSNDEAMGVDKSTLSDGTDESTNTGGNTQSPASLPAASPAKMSNESTNDGGKTQSPITGWVNSKKVVATFDGTRPSTQAK